MAQSIISLFDTCRFSVRLKLNVLLVCNEMPPFQDHKYRSSSKASDSGKTGSSADRDGIKYSSNSSNREKSRDKSKSDKERYGGGGGSSGSNSSKHRHKDREKERPSYPSSSSSQVSSPSSSSKVGTKVRPMEKEFAIKAHYHPSNKFHIINFAAGNFEDEEE